MLLPLLALLLLPFLAALPTVLRHPAFACSHVRNGCSSYLTRLSQTRPVIHSFATSNDVCVSSISSNRGFGPRLVPTRQEYPHPRHRFSKLHATDSDSTDGCTNPDISDSHYPVSPVNMLKHCMAADDVDCYQSHLKSFKDLPGVEALAAQFSAKKIWKYLNVNKSDPRYPFWLSRSQRGQDYFGRLSDGSDISQDDFGGFDPCKTSTYYYHTAWLQVLLSSKKTVSGMLKELLKALKAEDFVSRYVPVVLPEEFGTWEEFQEKWTLPPNVFNIVKALEIQDTNKRHHELDQLQKHIDLVLSERIFLLDDIIGSADFMFMLVWRFADDKDTKIQEFIQYLLIKGAPISERNIFLNYLDVISWENYPDKAKKLAKYEHVAKIIIRYSSGDAIKSLSGLLLQIFPRERDWVLFPILDAYHRMFPHASLNSPLIVQSLNHYIKTGHNHLVEMKVAAWFVKHGLRVEHVDVSAINGAESLSHQLESWTANANEQLPALLSFYDQVFPDLDFNSPSLIKSLALYVSRLSSFVGHDAVKVTVNSFFFYGLRAQSVVDVYQTVEEGTSDTDYHKSALSEIIMELKVASNRFRPL